MPCLALSPALLLAGGSLPPPSVYAQVIVLLFCFFPDPSQAREGPSRELSPREAPTSGWAALGLSYKVQWPLHILFTPAVLEK